MTDRDPEFYTPEIKHLLRTRNRLLRSGSTEKADALSVKINKLIISNNSQKLKGTNRGETLDIKDMWKLVKQLTGEDSSKINCSMLIAEDLNDHYANISQNKTYIKPINKPIAASQISADSNN